MNGWLHIWVNNDDNDGDDNDDEDYDDDDGDDDDEKWWWWWYWGCIDDLTVKWTAKREEVGERINEYMER